VMVANAADLPKILLEEVLAPLLMLLMLILIVPEVGTEEMGLLLQPSWVTKSKPIKSKLNLYIVLPPKFVMKIG